MSKLTLKNASLEDVDGKGYMFQLKTIHGKAYRGVFFPNDPGSLSGLEDAEELTFEGTVYLKTRAKEDTMPVTITNIVATRSGNRADFVAVDNPNRS